MRNAFEASPFVRTGDRLIRERKVPEPISVTANSEECPPQLIAGVDVWSLAIGPEEAFVLSRIDGRATVQEIMFSTGLEPDRVRDCLNRLVQVGAVRWPGSGPRPTAAASASSVSGEHRITTPGPTPGIRDSDPVPGSDSEGRPTERVPPVQQGQGWLFDPEELNEPVDLSPENRELVLRTFYSLDSLDHYSLLGVPQDADRRAIKAAYYERATVFHTDVYFGKSLGSFRAKMEKCFSRFTEAHDVLTRQPAKEEYDAYLESRREAQRVEAALRTEVTAEDLDRLERELAQIAATPDKPTSENPIPGALPSAPQVRPSDPDIRYASNRPSEPPHAPTIEQRRLSLARKLQSLRPAPGTRPSAPGLTTQQREQVAGQFLKEVAQKLESQRNALSAPPGSAAKPLVPQGHSEPPGTRPTGTDAASATLAANYRKQAEYEEKTGHMNQAAQSYQRAALAEPSAELWIGAARCLLQDGKDLRSAAEFAKLAIQLQPNRSEPHALLARIYLAADKRNSALCELERAHQLNPEDDSVAGLLKRLRRGSIV